MAKKKKEKFVGYMDTSGKFTDANSNEGKKITNNLKTTDRAFQRQQAMEKNPQVARQTTSNNPRQESLLDNKVQNNTMQRKQPSDLRTIKTDSLNRGQKQRRDYDTQVDKSTDGININGNTFKKLGKTAINTATNMGTGALRATEGVSDTANALTSKINANVTYGLNRLMGMDKKKAEQEREKEIESDRNYRKENQTQNLQNFVGYTDDVRKNLEKGSLVKSNNAGGQIAQSIGAMVPGLMLGQSTGGNIPLDSVKGLTGTELAKTAGKNVLKSLANQGIAQVFNTANSYGQGEEQALNEGATPQQASRYGALNALNNTAQEWITGGIPGLNGVGALDTLTDNAIDKATGKIANKAIGNLVGAGTKAVTGSLGEGLEEAAGDVFDTLNKRLTYDKNSKLNTNDVKNDFLLGTASGALLNAPANISNMKNAYNEGLLENNLNRINKNIEDNTMKNEVARNILDTNQEKREQNIRNIANSINESNATAGQNVTDNVIDNNNIPDVREDETLSFSNAPDGSKIRTNDNKSMVKEGNIFVAPENTPSESINNLNNSERVDRNGNKASNFLANITEKSKFLPEDFRSNEARQNYYNYAPESNRETMDRVLDNFEAKSDQQMLTDFFSKSDGYTNDDVGAGWVLLKRATDVGNYDLASQIAEKMSTMATESGRAVQMFNLMERLTPEGMLKYASNQLFKAQQKFNEGNTLSNIKKYASDFQLSGDESKFIVNNMQKVQNIMNGNYTIDDLKLDGDTGAVNSYNKWIDKQVNAGVDVSARSKDVLLAQIQSMLSNKLPRQKGQSLQSWMRISMLANGKTQSRNIVGNAAAGAVNAISDIPSSIIDKVISMKSGNRTIGLNQRLGSQFRGVKDASVYALQDARLGIDTKDVDINRFEVNGNKKAFNDEHTGVLRPLNVASKVGNAVDTALDLAMSGGDRIFYEPAYRKSLENQMALNNVETPTQDMIDLAKEEALQRTWNDDNNYTRAVLQIRRYLNKLGGKTFGYGLGDVLIPFAKTPANLTKAIVDYSPVGLAKSVVDVKGLNDSIKTGQLTIKQQHDFAQNLGKGVAGTLLYGIGAALAKAGVSSGGNDDDKDTADFEKNALGKQPYSIKIGNKSFSYDWLQPFGTALAIPADTIKSLSKSDDSTSTMEKAINIITKSGNVAAQQIVNQSFLQSIADVFQNNDGLVTGLWQQVLNLPARAVPTFVQQVSQMFDTTKRQTYEKNNPLGSAVNAVKVKIPGLSKTLPAQTSTMGNELKNYGGKKGNDIKSNLDYAYKVFLSPANYNEGKMTDASKEIYDVYKATEDNSVMPKQTGYTVKLDNGTTKNLTSKERSKIQKKSGKIIEKEIDKLLDDDEYNNLSSDKKAELIKKIVSYANAKGTSEVIKDKSISSTYRKADAANGYGYTIADFYLDKVLTTKEKSEPTDYNSAYKEMADKGIDAKTYERFREGIQDIRGDKNAKGNTIRGSAKANKIKWINENFPELSAEQKQALYDDYNAKQGMRPYYSYKRRDE